MYVETRISNEPGLQISGELSVGFGMSCISAELTTQSTGAYSTVL